MPYVAFLDAARALRHDMEALAARFGVSFEQACHRLSTLQRPDARGVPFFFVRVDGLLVVVLANHSDAVIAEQQPLSLQRDGRGSKIDVGCSCGLSETAKCGKTRSANTRLKAVRRGAGGQCTPAAPASIIAFINSYAFSGPPNPASASAMIGAIQ